ncbi:MAG: hypothetical protein ABI316_05450 [Casimicrobiaceae bacterium]
MSVSDLADPRVWPAEPAGNPWIAELHASAEAAIDASTGREADAFDANARHSLEVALATSNGSDLATIFSSAPSAVVARHSRRLLADVERGDPAASESLRRTLFAIPVILVAALDAGAQPVTLTGVLQDTTLANTLRDARAFGGCETFALSPSLVATEALDIAALPALLARRHVPENAGEFAPGALDLPPAPIDIDTRVERVYLRFLAGAVLTPPRVDPLRESNIGRWGIPFSQSLTTALHAPGISLLALPRPPQPLVNAVQSGRAAQREVSAQVFASNAIRKFRASYGEPTAIISAHRCADATGGGELRLSLSSPFAAREAEGFRCPIYPYETVQDVAAMLDALLRDCQVSDVRIMPGIHADKDSITGGSLFFKNAGASTGEPLH